MAALLSDIKPGDEVIMPSYTFVRLPLFYSITDEEVNRVIETLREYFY